METSALESLARRELQLVMTYAPAGLGHLRVMDALYHGLPEIVNPVVLGSQDRSIQTLHRITSIHPLLRKVFEWFQSGPLSAQFHRLYRASLRSRTGQIYEELVSLIEQKLEPPDEVLVVSTHFGLAHQLAAIKERLQREKRVKVFLAVVVTDDTFQHVWHVDGADLIVVPSHVTRDKYVAYGARLGAKDRIEVLPYPLALNLGRPLDSPEMMNKADQLSATGREPVRVSIPISGAAVGTAFFLQLIEGLREKSSRFYFHVVSKKAPYTSVFISRIGGMSGVEARVASVDREVVDAYDALFDDHVISLEVTKPSEQAFKALLGTELRGGVVLLFSEPVGRQEFENLDFLGRHGLVPSGQTNAKLWEMAESNATIEDVRKARLFDEARTWRGVRLPKDARKAVDSIWWMLTTGVFSQMMACQAGPGAGDEYPDELGANGVTRFWSLVVSAQA
jgi:hypothetical protein